MLYEFRQFTSRIKSYAKICVGTSVLKFLLCALSLVYTTRMFFTRREFPAYATIEKMVGETPLVSLEHLRANLHIPHDIPLAYAGRLDPMASGKLLIVIGDECKNQNKYHAFDKEYKVEVLLGASSDTGDVLGLLTPAMQKISTEIEIQKVLHGFIGPIRLPYPHFSAKTVHGKQLHIWTLENRLDEITIPIKESIIHKISFGSLRTISKQEILKTVRAKIETIPEVTEASKALGADFRRDKVRASWNEFEKNNIDTYQILSITCIASSGTYMRSLSEKIAGQLGTQALAYSIHRTKIGTYHALIKNIGFWTKRF